MDKLSTNRRFSRISELDREMVRELCDLHVLDMGQLCQRVGLNRSAFSNFLTGRRPLPQTYAAQFLRQLGLTVKGELDPRHCFTFVVGPGLEDLAVKWLTRLCPQGGKMFPIVKHDLNQVDVDEFSQEVYDPGVVLVGEIHVAVVRDDIHFGDFSWVPGNWNRPGKLVTDSALRLLDSTRPATRDDVNIAMGAVETIEAPSSWAMVRSAAEASGFSSDDVIDLIDAAIRSRMLAK